MGTKAEHIFIRRDAEIERVYATILDIAGGRSFLVKRFIFEWHGYKASDAGPRDLIVAYLEHLGYSGARVADFPEISTERALFIVGPLWLHDFARHEDLLPSDAATICTQAIRDAVEPWAILAFTNLLEPNPPPYAPERPFGGRFIPVLQRKSAEAGVVLIGEEDIAMIWFDDDDSPKRSIWSYSEYQRAIGRRK